MLLIWDSMFCTRSLEFFLPHSLSRIVAVIAAYAVPSHLVYSGRRSSSISQKVNTLLVGTLARRTDGSFSRTSRFSSPA